MLRRCVLAMACFAILKTGPVQAEAVKAEPAPANGPASAAAPSKPATPSTQANAGSTVEKPAETSAPSSSEAKPADDPAATSSDKPASSEPAKPVEKAAESAAPAKPAAPPEPTMKVAVDLKTQRMTVTEHGAVKHSWPISSGAAEFPTPRGTFRPQWTAKMWYSKKYDNAPMPHAVFINGGVAIHATYHTRSLGRPASHGCIRLAPANAATFYKLVHKHGLKMTRVSVYGTPKYSAPAVASRSELTRRYAARQQDEGSFWGTPRYKPTAYTQGYSKPRYQRQPKIYYYSDTPRAYRRYNGARVVYQRPPRRIYYNRYGYGYDGGW
jgi:lipoprotein-anchoring transpeptidase ErfK/SrfK